MSIVCCHSGLPQDQCDYSCRFCRSTFRACPDRESIYGELTLAIQARWSPADERQRRVTKARRVEVVEALRVTDHMVRWDGERRAQ